ncbi:uncharacterized protein CG7065-like [Anopheles nili]|uniref:uncharacterized protein CG7065-like n=1 Tax=Anopheles nili TaxID=185578 RepID=UPI00237A89A3|nr:uncharacterized protein CG7065-like [Anopheles nili]
MDLESSNDVIAPGDNVARSKPETDIEKHVLGTTIKLSNGTEGFVFSRTPRNKDLLFGYSCHICGVVCLYGERMLQIHIAGRKHQARLNVVTFDADQYHASLVTKPKGNLAGGGNNADINSGNLAQLQENEASSTKTLAKLQNVLDGYRDGPLVGLEYIVELKGSIQTNDDPCYSCVLCNLHNESESGITTHMIGLGHRFKFLERHYPTVRKVLVPYRNAKAENGGQVFFRVVQTVCEAIEDHHGRLTPQVYEAGDFERNRVKYGQQIAFGSHFDERTGPKFVEVIDAKVLQDLSNADDGAGQGSNIQKRYRSRNDRGSLDSISSVSSANSMLTISSDGENIGDPDRSRHRSPLNGGRRNSDHRRGDMGSQYSRHHNSTQRSNDAPSSSKQMIPTPRELSQQSAAIAHERYKWEKYRCTVDLAVGQLTKQLKEYEKSPEKHPLYSEEWKKFWNRRYKELQAEKKDPQRHNFKPEWIEFWTKRMKELHEEEVKRKKEEIRTKMNLPAEDEERTDELREQFSLRVPTSSNKRSRSGDRISGNTTSAPILIDVNSDEEEDDYMGGQPRTSKDKARSSRLSSRRDDFPESTKKSRSHRSRSPITDDLDMYSSGRTHRTAPVDRNSWSGGAPKHNVVPSPERVDYDEWAKNYYGPNKKVFVRTEFESENNTPLNFISVCRLLTAFEDYLGSLGPKVIELLAKALALEKVKANSADDLLLNEDNCMFLETVKEKLKGHMMAETIEASKMAPIKKAVKNIARLLHEASKREPVKPMEDELSRDSLPVSDAVPPIKTPSPSVASIDKIAVAEQLAKSLVAQGKTDFTTEELEQLINVYIAMVKLSRERNTHITTKAYLALLPVSTVPLARKEAAPSPVASGLSQKMVPERVRPEPAAKVARWTETTNQIVRSISSGLAGIEPADPRPPSSAVMLENLTDSDLQTLLQSFKELSSDEQMHLISYLRKLERAEPDRVEKLRRYVNFDAWANVPLVPKGREKARDLSDEDERNYRNHGDEPNFDMFRPSEVKSGERKQTQNPMISNGQTNSTQRMQQQTQKDMNQLQKGNSVIVDSEDEDDYSYDDILRAASKNVSTIPQQQSKTTADTYDTNSNNSHRNIANNETGVGTSTAGISLSDTQNLIANLMESLQKSVSDANNQSANVQGSSGTSRTGQGNTYANPISTIGALAGGGVSASMSTADSASTTQGTYPSYPQQQQQSQQGMAMMSGYGQQQTLNQMQGSTGQMQSQFGGQYMYQGQMFGANGSGQQQMQYGYGNYGYY